MQADPQAQIDEAAVRAVAARLRATADTSVPEYEAAQLLAAAGVTSSRGAIAGSATRPWPPPARSATRSR